MLKRACLYLRRRYKRSILLFLLLFIISLSLSVGLSAWNGINTVTKEIEQQLGTSFVFKLPAIDTKGTEYSQIVYAQDGTATQSYIGPKLDKDFVHQIMQVDGISAYNGELENWVCTDNVELISGTANELYQKAQTDSDRMQAMILAEGNIGSLGYYEVRRRTTVIYGNTDTSLYDKFRTGAFELIAGRHIQPNDQQKVLISEEIAELNHLNIGDKIHISLRNVHLGRYEEPKKVLGEIDLEIVGIFHVNGYQPTGNHVSERSITYNWLLSDENTVAQVAKLWDQNYYKNFITDFAYDNLTFFVDDPTKLNEIIDRVKQLDVEGIDFFDLSRDDTMYKSTVEPLNSIRNLITGMMVALAAGCVIVLLIVFTLWVRDRRKEIAIYISMGLEKASIVGQLLLEAVIITAIAFAIAFPISQPLTDYAGNTMLASSIEAAQPDDTPKEYSLDELRQAALSGRMNELFSYETSTYSGPEQIDFLLGAPELAALAALELLIIAGAICKGSMFLFRMAPKQILTDLR